MANAIFVLHPSGLVAGADLSGEQFKFVKLDAAGDVVLCDTEGETVLGVLENKPLAGEVALVAAVGQCAVQFGAIVAPGPIMTDVNGQAIAHTGTNVIAGYNITAQAGVPTGPELTKVVIR